MNHHGGTGDTKWKSNWLAGQIIAAGIEVHRHRGPGLLEAAYAGCLAKELQLRNITYESQVPLPLIYKGEKLDCGYRLDLLVDKSVIVELKSVDQLAPIHSAQLLTYLRLTKLWLGLLINFNVDVLKHGIRRLVNG